MTEGPAESELDSLLSKRLLFVTGKGGVGKTTVAASLAWLASSRHLRTLLCQVDAKGDLQRMFGHGHIGFQPERLRQNLWAMTMDTEAALQEYLKIYLRMPIMPRLGPLAKAFDFVANAAPGVREILVVGKLCWEVREDHYDIIVVDSAASGHVVSQLASPKGVGELFKVGLVSDQTTWMSQILSDPKRSGVCLVSTAEETPVQESIELAEDLENQTDISLALVVANRVFPSVFSKTEGEIFEWLDSNDQRGVIEKAVGKGWDGLVEAADLWSSISSMNKRYVQRLRSEVAGSVPLVEVSEVISVPAGFGLINEVAESIEAGLS
ncbi:MAG: ArsA family ATPase [Acidimicrobiaceae bacterium]|nr:ArsA family ATPase [Acidimicrobiaceae bacterium]